MKTIVWKATTMDGKSAQIRMRGQVRHYRKGVTVRPLPGMGPLMAFSTKQAAEEMFATSFVDTSGRERKGPFRVRRAEAVIAERRPNRLYWIGVIDDEATRDDLKRFWGTRIAYDETLYYPWDEEKWPITYICYIPEEQVFCDEITCLE